MKLRSAKEGATLVPAAERRSDCDGRKDQLRRIRERPKTQVGGEGPAFKGNFVTLKYVAKKQILKKDQYGTVVLSPTFFTNERFLLFRDFP